MGLPTKKDSLFLILLWGTSAFADGSGCLSSAGAGKMMIDTQCGCLKNNSCVKLKIVKVSDSFYNTKDRFGNKVFSNVERKKLKESNEVFSKIIELKSTGKVNSDEIKELYIKLDKLNYDVRKSLLENHTSDYANAKNAYKEGIKNRKKQNRKLTEKIVDILQGKNSAVNNLASTQTHVKPVEEKKESVSGAIIVSKLMTKEELAKEQAKNEKATILKHLKPEKLQRDENDSLFDIITKSYERSAYPTLLGE